MDIDHNRRVKDGLRRAVESTATDRLVQGFGAFAGGFRVPAGYRDPVLVASTDSLGTKLALAIEWDDPEGAGRDMVHHCLNDVAVQNARPLAFLDYVAAEQLDPAVVRRLVEGMADALVAAGADFIGGESAQLPRTYRPGAYDLAGTMIGIAERSDLPDPATVTVGDVCVGLPSSGPHSNGYSLAGRVAAHLDADTPVGGQSLRAALLAPHVSYQAELARAFETPGVRAAAHITGGGLIENIPRVLPESLAARLRPGAWPRPPVFDVIQRDQDVADAEMFRVFNMGVGMVIIAAPEASDTLQREIEGSFVAGEIVARTGPPVELEAV